MESKICLIIFSTKKGITIEEENIILKGIKIQYPKYKIDVYVNESKEDAETLRLEYKYYITYNVGLSNIEYNYEDSSLLMDMQYRILQIK